MSVSTPPTVLYILYNADASVTGKLAYGYRKLTAPKDKPVCAACDITHGGLHLDETAEWKRAREEISQGGAVTIKQVHRDELDANIKQYVETNKLRYPMVLSSDGDKNLSVVLDNAELVSCSGDTLQFVQKLREKRAIPVASASS